MVSYGKLLQIFLIHSVKTKMNYKTYLLILLFLFSPSSKEAAREFLQLRFNLKGQDRDHFGKYYLSPDRSPSDRKRLKELVEEKRNKNMRQFEVAHEI